MTPQAFDQTLYSRTWESEKFVDPNYRLDLGKWLQWNVTQAEQTRDAMSSRWERLEAMYRMDPSSTADVTLLEGVTLSPQPLMTPRLNRITESVMARLTAPDPWVQVSVVKGGQQRADALERGLQAIGEQSGFERQFSMAVRHAALNGVGIVRTTLVQGEGFVDEFVHARHFVVEPHFRSSLDDAHLVGHQFTLPLWRVLRMMEHGEYYYEPSVRGDDSGATTGLYQDSLATPGPVQGVDADRRPVTLYELIVRLRVDGEFGLWRVVYERLTGRVLQLERYPYSRPWYTDVRLHEEYGRFYNENSKANEMQGLQNDFNLLTGLLTQGSTIAALPPIFVSGGFLRDGLRRYFPAQLIETDSPVQASQLPYKFDLQAVLSALKEIEERADGIAGISQIGVGQQLRPGATATEAEELARSQAAGEDAYLKYVAMAVERLYEMRAEMCSLHQESVQSVYGPILEPEFWQGLNDAPVRSFVVTGQSGNQTPSVMAATCQQIVQMSMVPGSPIDSYEAITQMVRTMPGAQGLDLDALLLTREQVQQRQMQAAALQGGGGVPGPGDGPAPMGGATGVQGPGAPMQPPGRPSPSQASAQSLGS